jgi:hypothetical protein
MAQSGEIVRFDALASGPVVSRERFAEMIGLPVGVIVGWCNKGLVPTVALGKYSLVNLAALHKSCVSAEFKL